MSAAVTSLIVEARSTKFTNLLGLD
jgi:hypothetical protein